ncbi:MAG: elongation factor P maturation arginine rhamnosyltransferase EarP [Cellvibrio sp.]
MASPTRPIWDIFCRVIDNFGDIGVCWRLARQLAREYPVHVRLWVDDLSALITIWPDASNCDDQMLDGVRVLRWIESNESIFIDVPAQVVIEAFACEIPASYQALMAKNKENAPRWINLDYLSAEPWVEDCHNLASISPATGLKKTFFFPGFTQKTGGLIRESGLIEVHGAWLDRGKWLAEKGVHPTEDATLISLFAYENSGISVLIEAWIQSGEAIHCLVPHGKVTHSVNAYLCAQGLPDLSEQTPLVRIENLTIQNIPFLKQDDYDKLLWSMNINFVRGEDSFVRANWAAIPFVWHIYVQDEDAHLEKLSHYLNLFLQSASPNFKTQLSNFWMAWNRGDLKPEDWHQLIQHKSEWREHCKNWREELCKIKHLAEQLYESTI